MPVDSLSSVTEMVRSRNGSEMSEIVQVNSSAGWKLVAKAFLCLSKSSSFAHLIIHSLTLSLTMLKSSELVFSFCPS